MAGNGARDGAALGAVGGAVAGGAVGGAPGAIIGGIVGGVIGGAIGGAREDFTGQTILETFQPYKTNLVPADIKPGYATTHGLDSSDKIAAHFFPGSGNNGTFTVSTGNQIADQHGGMSGATEAQAQLAAPKQIEKILDQTYEATPGTALGKYEIKRILKTDGSMKIAKKKI